ncbi:hypothetical protein BpHYR1_033321, partial [Brachionus plicatilis]
GHNIAKCPIKETLCEKKLKSLERKKIDYNDLYIDQEETQSIIGADQKDNDANMMPKTPGYQPTNFNDVISQISTQELKTPVLEDTLKPLVVLENENDNTFESESNSSTTECSIQVDQSSNEDGQQTASQNSIEENLE